MIRPYRQRPKRKTLLPLEAVQRALLDRLMQTHIRDMGYPALSLRIEIPVTNEFTAVDEIAAQIPNRPLDLAFRFGPVWTARSRLEIPVVLQIPLP